MGRIVYFRLFFGIEGSVPVIISHTTQVHPVAVIAVNIIINQAFFK